MSKKIPFDILQCPDCLSDKLSVVNHEIICDNCKTSFGTRDDKYLFFNLQSEDVSDSLDRIKFIVKKYPRFYSFLVMLISPVYVSRKKFRSFLEEFTENSDCIAVNLGSGNTDISSNVSNVDIFAYENVDLTCNIEKLPFKDESIDVIINKAVLEHVPNPENVVTEIQRVLKNDGIFYLVYPFMQGFHASPYDFSRRTSEGVKLLMNDFDILESYVCGGPTSGFLWVLQEWFAIVFSFGSKRLHSLIYIMMMLLTFPLKFLDTVLQHHPNANTIASSFTVIGKKK